MITTCPMCQSPLVTQSGAKEIGSTAETYADCNRICVPCGIGLSNAASRPTFIRKDWRDGLWRRSTAVRLDRLVDRALNEVSRQKKRRRLANERSEDLLTWNVFSWLDDRSLLGQVIRWTGLPESSETPSIYYWGATERAVPGMDLADLLVRRFAESPRSLSEPDVIIVGQDSLVFVEAKFGSANDRQVGTKSDPYVNGAPTWFRASSQATAQAGYYELTRNWAIGGALADQLGRRFALVNLVRSAEETRVGEELGPLLADRGRFLVRTWSDLVWAIEPALVAHLRDETLSFAPAFPGLALDRPSS